MNNFLEIKNLFVEVLGKKILRGVNLKLKRGEMHILLGPNGAGKTTLAMVVAGDPHYKITKGQIILDGKGIKKLSPDQRARLGIFLCFQKPVEIPGVSLKNILRKASQKGTGQEEEAKALKINPDSLSRSFEGFSGGEGKKLELLQAKILGKKFLLVDEIDSGLDLDNLKLVTDNLKQLVKNGTGVLLITHNLRILKLIRPNRIHVLIGGLIVATSGMELAEKVEKKGYLWLSKKRD